TAVTCIGTLNSVKETTFTVLWYFSEDLQCVENQEKSKTLDWGKVPVTTDTNGDAQFSFPVNLRAGHNKGVVNATATEKVTDLDGNTSEFSPCAVVDAS